MRACFICETPYQVFNSINFVMNQKEYEFEACDIYLGEKFNGFSDIYDALVKEEIFNGVFRYSYKDEEKNGFSHLFFRFCYVIVPSSFISVSMKKFRILADDISYSHIFVSTLTRFGMAMIMVNPNAKVCFFDDGTSSYVGAIGLESITRNRRIVYKLLGKDYRHLYPWVMYVNNVEMCNTEWDVPIKALPDISGSNSGKSFIEAVHRVFNNPIHEYKELHYVVLSQPSDDGVRKEDPVVSLCNTMGLNYIYRPHPRDESQEVNAPILDDSGALWEMICAEDISGNHVLISKCSTAQFSPKLLFGKEPYLIFTYKLYECDNKDICDNYHYLCETIKKSYIKKEKIYEVEDIENLKRVLENLAETVCFKDSAIDKIIDLQGGN